MNDRAEGGTDWELRAAEDLIASAPGGSPALALAMRRHSEAVRNMMQGVLVPMFVEMVERAMDTRLGPLRNEVTALRSEVGALETSFRAELATHTERLDAKRARIDDLERRIRALEARGDGAG